jgi:predicted acylesterase/phospholipase RssA
MTIKHIVLCGGGPVGIVSYGAIKELVCKNIIDYEEIKSIYTTSIGCMVALIFLLKLEWNSIDDFIIKRPWGNLMNFSSVDYFNLIFTKGLCDETFIITCLKPLFLAADVDINITLREFYNLTKVHWHIFTSNLNKFTKVDLNYITHPDLTVIQAIHMSLSIPVLIKPPFYNNEYYIDGGLFSNNPVKDCYLYEECSPNEIIAFINDKRCPVDTSNIYFTKIQHELLNEDISNNNLTENTNIFSFLYFIIKTVFNKIMIIENENDTVSSLSHNNIINVCINQNTLDINYWSYVFSNKEEREHLIELGKTLADNYIIKINNNDISNNIINTTQDISFNLNDIKVENIVYKPSN